MSRCWKGVGTVGGGGCSVHYMYMYFIELIGDALLDEISETQRSKWQDKI